VTIDEMSDVRIRISGKEERVRLVRASRDEGKECRFNFGKKGSCLGAVNELRRRSGEDLQVD